MRPDTIKFLGKNAEKLLYIGLGNNFGCEAKSIWGRGYEETMSVCYVMFTDVMFFF